MTDLKSKLPQSIRNAYQVVRKVYHYRRPEFITCMVLVLFCLPMLQPGDVTFSDLAFGRSAEHYSNYVWGVFNEQLEHQTGLTFHDCFGFYPPTPSR